MLRLLVLAALCGLLHASTETGPAPQCTTEMRNRCRQISCHPAHKPLCGTDFTSYRNRCELSRRNCFNMCYQRPHVRVLYEDRCRPICQHVRSCQSNNIPLCGSNGETYRDNCALMKARCSQVPNRPIIISIHQGRCKERWCRNFQRCQHTYQPVCGTDKKTYRNICIMTRRSCIRPYNRRRILQAYYGQCRACETINCPSNSRPVCATDGKIYGNGCLLNLENCHRASRGEPRIWKDPEGKCSQE